MADSLRPSECDDPRVYFAAERTLLAWVRTGLALMGFGFIVARFGLFLRELAATHSEVAARPTGYSLATGVALVALGMFVTGWAGLRHYRWVRRLRHGEVQLPRAFSLAVIVASAVAVIGLALALGLVLGLHH